MKDYIIACDFDNQGMVVDDEEYIFYNIGLTVVASVLLLLFGVMSIKLFLFLWGTSIIYAHIQYIVAKKEYPLANLEFYLQAAWAPVSLYAFWATLIFFIGYALSKGFVKLYNSYINQLNKLIQ